MRYIESPSNDAYFNMALEEYVFESLPRDQEYFILWQNADTIVVGKYQNTIEEINEAYVREKGIKVVRRLSGGGAMYQDLGNLNFTFVVDQNEADRLDFDLFLQPVIRALRGMGVPAEANSRNDIVIEGKKFSGNSQYNKKKRTMHHGTLLYNSDLGAIGEALRVNADKIASKGIKSVRSRVTNIIDYMPQKPPLADFKQALLQQMFQSGGLAEYTLSEKDMEAIRRLRDEKYATWEWNWGKSPAYNQRKERRFPFGGVSLLLEVEEGKIRSIRIFGDFFGNGEITGLQERLAGCPVRYGDILEALSGVDVGDYIRGMGAEELAGFIAH